MREGGRDRQRECSSKRFGCREGRCRVQASVRWGREAMSFYYFLFSKVSLL